MSTPIKKEILFQALCYLVIGLIIIICSIGVVILIAYYLSGIWHNPIELLTGWTAKEILILSAIGSGVFIILFLIGKEVGKS